MLEMKNWPSVFLEKLVCWDSNLDPPLLELPRRIFSVHHPSFFIHPRKFFNTGSEEKKILNQTLGLIQFVPRLEGGVKKDIHLRRNFWKLLSHQNKINGQPDSAIHFLNEFVAKLLSDGLCL